MAEKLFSHIVPGTTTGASAAATLNGLGNDSETCIKSIDSIANVGNLNIYKDGSIVFAEDEKIYYYYDLDTDAWIQSPNFSTFGDGGTNYTNFDATGHQTMGGDARSWRDEASDALSLKQTGPGVSANASENTVEFTESANLSDYVYTNVQLNHDRDLTSNIFPHIHWFQALNQVPNFLLQYRWQINGGAKVTAWTNLRCVTPVFTYVSGTIHQIAGTISGIAVPVGTNVSDIVQFRVLRDTTNASTLYTGTDQYAAIVGIISFDVHIQQNSVGSTEIYTK